MSGTHSPAADSGRLWADLDSRNEKLVDASHPLLRVLADAKADGDRSAAVRADAGR